MKNRRDGFVFERKWKLKDKKEGLKKKEERKKKEGKRQNDDKKEREQEEKQENGLRKERRDGFGGRRGFVEIWFGE